MNNLWILLVIILIDYWNTSPKDVGQADNFAEGILDREYAEFDNPLLLKMFEELYPIIDLDYILNET